MKFSIVLIEYLIVLFNIVAAFSPSIRDNGRIFNGHDANIGQFPYVVSLEIYKTNQIEFCSGSLIAPTWVLTAAHCFDEIHTVLIILGSTLREDAEAGYNLPPENVIRYPGYNQYTLLHDIALVSVPETEPCSLISTIALPPFHPYALPSYVGKYGSIIGWGGTKRGEPYSNILQWGIMRVIDKDVCKRVDPSVNIAKLCAAVVNDMSPCQGDSGGPFVVESVLIGVISYLANDVADCEDSEPIILTRVDFYMDWIKDVTGIE